MAAVVAHISQLARQSPQVNQRSGVSVRLGVANYETLVAAAARRGLRLGEKEAVPRVSDLTALVSSTAGKVELDSLDDGEEDIVGRLTRQAVLSVFRERVDPSELAKAVAELDDGSAIEVGDDLPSSGYVEALSRHPGLRAPAGRLAGLGKRRSPGRGHGADPGRAAPIQAAQQAPHGPGRQLQGAPLMNPALITPALRRPAFRRLALMRPALMRLAPDVAMTSRR